MITHDNPSEHYITQVLINKEYHGNCYLNDSISPKRCDFVDCEIYHDQIVSSNDMMKFEFYYNDHKDQNISDDKSNLSSKLESVYRSI